MKRLWSLVGQVAFWILWPVLYFYLIRSERSRVIITSQDKVLLVKGWLGRGHWILPGGGIHHGEDAEKGAVREVLEETGIKLSSSYLKKIGNGTASEYGLKFNYIVFLASLSETQSPTRQKWEMTEAAWLPLSGILQRSDISPETHLILSSWKH